MLIAKGYNVSFVLEDGRTVRGAQGAEILHDETGVDWPRESGLLISFRRTGESLTRVPNVVRRYFGDSHDVKRGRVRLPPKRLSSWTKVGVVCDAMYSRRGEHADDYVHTFGERKLFGLLPGKPMPILYSFGAAYRLDGVEDWDWGGFRS